MNINDIADPISEEQEDSEIATQPEFEEEEQAPDELREQIAKYYWAKPTQECIKSLISRTNEYYNYINATGKMALWRMSFEQYNRGLITLGSVSRGGVEGELLNLPINEFRNLADHVIGLTTHDKLAFEPQPINNDYTTSAQVTLSKGILRDYANNKGLDASGDKLAETAYIFGEGSILKLFNENLGDLKYVDTGAQKIYRKGDIQFISVNPTNLIRDIQVQEFQSNQWFIVRLFVNKYDLAAQYPDKAKEICEKSITTDWDNTRITSSRGDKSDLVPLFIGLHKKTSAMPFGRMIFYIDSDLWLEDGHLEYREFPLYTMMPSPVESINFGYTTAFDLLPLQQVLDIIDGGLATNLSNFVVSNVLVPDGCNLGVADLIGSMNLLKYNPQAGEPKALNLVMFPPEAPNFRAFVAQRMEVLSGINSTVRGQVDEKITSGEMAALYASQAIHFNNRFQKSYILTMSALASGIIYDLQDHPEDQRTGLVAGKGNQAYLTQFYGKDVNQINRVTVTIGSPFMQTAAGKYQMAIALLNTPSGLNPRQFLEVVETGSLEPLTEGPHREMMYIKSENEMIMDGQPVKASITDNHDLHVQEHKNTIADAKLRMSNDPKAAQVVNAAMTHMAEHEQLKMQLQTTRPVLAAMLGQAGPPPPPAPRQLPPPSSAPKQALPNGQNIPNAAQPPQGAPNA